MQQNYLIDNTHTNKNNNEENVNNDVSNVHSYSVQQNYITTTEINTNHDANLSNLCNKYGTKKTNDNTDDKR